MFVRVIEGRVLAKPMLRNAWDHFAAALRDHEAWLWSTGGIHRNGFSAVLGFSSQDGFLDAIRSPEAARWVGQLLANLEDPKEESCEDVQILLRGGEIEAGFVQFITGHTPNKKRLSAVLEGMQEMMRVHRPDILGAHQSWLSEGRFLQTVYFTSEHEARAAEDREFPGGMHGMLAQLMQLMDGLTYLDVKDPWLAVNHLSLEWVAAAEETA